MSGTAGPAAAGRPASVPGGGLGRPAADPPAPVIEAAGLASGYRGRTVWSGADFSVGAGEFLTVLGPNGAGKSSLLAAMAGVFPIASGEVTLQGKAISQWRPEALADWRAWCPQFWSDPFPSTVAETAAIAMRRGAWWNAEADDRSAVMHVLGGRRT